MAAAAKASSSAQLNRFKQHMKQMSGNLSDLGLEDEKKRLEAHLAVIEAQIDRLTVLAKTVSDIHDMVGRAIITDETRVSVLNDWLEHSEELADRLRQAKDLTDLAAEDINAAAKVLQDFQRACEAQLKACHRRLSEVYNIGELDSLTRIANWSNEVSSLISLYEGQERDVEDLLAVQAQLDLVEQHYKLLDSDTLSEGEFRSLVERYKEENDAAFGDDAPPLDNELIYESIMDALSRKRAQFADEWMRTNVPPLKDIEQASASDVLAYQGKLQRMPAVLSLGAESRSGGSARRASERRLGELQVEGALAQFEALSEEVRLALEHIWDYLEEYYGKTLRPSS